ncbi:MFS transporter [Thermogutta sp.]|uniref:MFS transporter n=1 Tax=Thermogutta sp. TaxID=1962930 RepID=UPI003C7C2B56
MYDFTFWLAYLSNALVSAANTLLCRYADFVNFLGGTEYHLGWIVGIGMVGSLLGRFALGDSIDRFGARRLWLITILGTTASCLLHLVIFDYRSPLIYFARILYILMLAGVFSASMTLITGRVTKERLAEVIGIFGSAGFAGVVLGAPLADVLFPHGISDRWSADRLFLVAAALCLLSYPLACLVPERNPNHRMQRRQTRSRIDLRGQSRQRKRPSTFGILCHYWPGSVVAAGIVAGAALFIPPTFLPRFVAEMGVHDVSGFFVLYAVTAITVRSVILRPLQRWGLERVIAAGLVILAISQLLFLIVRRPWQLVIPGLVFGLGHALLFPAIVGLGSAAYPKRHRGLATTLMMATFDAGLFVGGPIAGAVLRFAGDFGLPRYSAMFVAVCVSVLVFDAVFVWLQRAKVFRKHPTSDSHCAQETLRKIAEISGVSPAVSACAPVSQGSHTAGVLSAGSDHTPALTPEVLSGAAESPTPAAVSGINPDEATATIGHRPS